jgi:hypothetical protein
MGKNRSLQAIWIIALIVDGGLVVGCYAWPAQAEMHGVSAAIPTKELSAQLIDRDVEFFCLSPKLSVPGRDILMKSPNYLERAVDQRIWDLANTSLLDIVCQERQLLPKDELPRFNEGPIRLAFYVARVLVVREVIAAHTRLSDPIAISKMLTVPAGVWDRQTMDRSFRILEGDPYPKSGQTFPLAEDLRDE